MTKEIAYHCQICARAIRAKNGIIAHHGYQRPHGQGWQTASCYGARHVPYEVGHDALDYWIQALEGNYIPRQLEWVASLTASPPASYDVTRKDAWGQKCGPDVIAQRPVDFDPTRRPASFRSSQSYEWAYWEARDRADRDLTGMRTALSDATARRAAWVAPT